MPIRDALGRAICRQLTWAIALWLFVVCALMYTNLFFLPTQVSPLWNVPSSVPAHVSSKVPSNVRGPSLSVHGCTPTPSCSLHKYIDPTLQRERCKEPTPIKSQALQRANSYKEQHRIEPTLQIAKSTKSRHSKLCGPLLSAR